MKEFFEHSDKSQPEISEIWILQQRNASQMKNNRANLKILKTTTIQTNQEQY